MFDVNSKTLIETARRLRDEGTLPTGRKVGGNAAFFIGAADMPIDPPAGWQPNVAPRQGQIRRAIRADAILHGCRRSCAAMSARSNMPASRKQLAILIGVNPLRSAKSAAWMKSTCSAPSFPMRLSRAWKTPPIRRAKASRICVELIDELSTIPGVAGVHIMAPGNDAAIPR